MTSLADQVPHWHHTIRIRPDNPSGQMRLIDIEDGQSRNVAPVELAQAILRGEALRAGDVTADVHNEASWRHWRHRSWHPSDDFYVASRRPNRDPVSQFAGDEIALDPVTRQSGTWISLEHDRSAVNANRLQSLLKGRRTERVFHRAPVDQATTGNVLWMGFQDVRTKRCDARHPSVTQSDMWYARRSTSVGLIVFDVDGLEPGSYHYDIDNHQVQLVKPGQHREAMVSALQGMRTPNTAAWTLVIFADTDLLAGHQNPERMMRSVFVAAGVLGQAIIVGTEEFGMATLVTPAQKDSDVVELLGLDDRRFLPLYTLTAGEKRRRNSDRTEWHG